MGYFWNWPCDWNRWQKGEIFLNGDLHSYRLQRELHEGEAEGKQESNEELADQCCISSYCNNNKHTKSFTAEVSCWLDNVQQGILYPHVVAQCLCWSKSSFLIKEQAGLISWDSATCLVHFQSELSKYLRFSTRDSPSFRHNKLKQVVVSVICFGLSVGVFAASFPPVLLVFLYVCVHLLWWGVPPCFRVIDKQGLLLNHKCVVWS